MVLREVGGLLHAVASGAGIVRTAHCESRKIDVSKDAGSDAKGPEAKGSREKAYNRIPEWAKEWGEDVEWVSLEEGAKLSRNQFKPLMVIVERRDCPKCEILRTQTCLSDDFTNVSKDFVMVVVEQTDLDPKDEVYRPDGEYTPRALFFHPDGPFLARYTNDFLKTPNKYFYRSPRNLVRVMNKAKFYFLDPN